MPVVGDERGSRVSLRRVRETDVADLAGLYSASVYALGPEHYSAEAVRVWAAFSQEAGFRRFVLDPYTLVAEDESGLLGFAGLEVSGRIVSLYVRPDRARAGIGSRLLSALLERGESTGIRQVWTQASALSKPLFQRFGFRLVSLEVVERYGTKMERYIMERGLQSFATGQGHVS